MTIGKPLYFYEITHTETGKKQGIYEGFTEADAYAAFEVVRDNHPAAPRGHYTIKRTGISRYANGKFAPL